MSKHGGGSAGAIIIIMVLALALLAPNASAATCANEAFRKAAPTLPGCLALEMVSPAKKFSQPAYLPFFSRDGERLLMVIQTAVDGAPGYQYYGGDRYVASRNPEGWDTASTSPPDPTVAAGGRRWGSAAAFTPDLARWVQLAATQAQSQVGVARLFGGGLDRSFNPLSPLLAPVDNSGTKATQQAVEDLKLTGASADLSTTVLKVNLASTGYFAEDPRSNTISEPGGDTNSYVSFLDEAGEPALELLARDKDGTAFGGRCGAHLGGPGASFDQGSISNTFNQGAIANDGSRVFFSTRSAQPWNEEAGEGPPCELKNGLRVLERVATSEGPAIKEIAPEGGAGEPGDDLFQAASADGSKVYLLTPRKLTGSDVDLATGPCSGNLGASEGCDLYLYDATLPEGDRMVHVSAGDGPEPADVLNSATAISGDGSRAYFVAQGVLTTDTNPEGAVATLGQPNLYLFETDGDLSFLGTLSAEDAAGLWATKGTRFGDAYAAPLYGETGAAEGGSGHIFAFASKAPLTADDTDGGFRDVFRYDANADTMQRVSKAVPGGEDNGEYDVTVNPAFLKVIEYNFGEATRWVSEDGELLAFATAEPLIPGDGDEATNPYVWSEGELGAAFAKLSAARPPAVAPEGGEIAFSTSTALLGGDGDAAEDVYVARANGGFAEPSPATPCNPLQEGSCKGPPSPKPGLPPPPANGLSGNVMEKAPKKCKKGRVKRKGKCVKKPGKRKAAMRGGRG